MILLPLKEDKNIAVGSLENDLTAFIRKSLQLLKRGLLLVKARLNLYTSVVIILLVGMISGCSKEPNNNGEGVHTMKWLSMSTNPEGARYIVDENNEPFHMFGMARCQYHSNDDEDPAYGGITGLITHFKYHGVNSFRLAVDNKKNGDITDLIEESGGYNPEGIQKYIDTYVDPDVQALIQNNMRVILDLHLYPPSSDNPAEIVAYAREHYFPIWIELAKRYKDEPMIAMYELWNEPYPADQGTLKLTSEGKVADGKYAGYDWNADVRDFFVDLVKLIRDIDKRHILLISDFNAGWGTGWGTTWKGFTDDLDPGIHNIIFSVHAAKQHLDDDFLTYQQYWKETASQNNIGLWFGEIETEDDLMNARGIENLVAMLEDAEESYHFGAMLWRPHNDVANYSSYWSDFAKSYNTFIEK